VALVLREMKAMSGDKNNPNPPVVSESQVTYPSALNPQTAMTPEEIAEKDRAERTRGAPVVRTATRTPIQPVNKKPEPPKGYAYDLDPAAVEPGDVGQMFLQSPGEGQLVGIVYSSDCEPTRLIVGNYNREWKDVQFPVAIAAGNFVILLAKNITDEPQLIMATGYFSGPNIAPPPHPPRDMAATKASFKASMPSAEATRDVNREAVAQAAASATQPSPALAPPPPGVTMIHGQYQPPVPQNTVGPGAVSAGRSVTPGANEVAICLPRNDVRLLIEAARNGGIPDQNKWGIIRRLEDALR
jgi:hypothetical protein